MTLKSLLRAGVGGPAALALVALSANAALAQEAAAPAAPTLDTGNTAWMITATVLVLFMFIPGLGLFYGGLVRSKNMLSVLTQVLAVASLAMIVWVIYGYSIAFTDGTAFIGGLSKMFLAGVSPDSIVAGQSIPEYVFLSFQMTFAAITTALIVGGFAERIKFSAVLLFAVLWMTFVYFPIAHMVWTGDGYLAKMGALDFAGGTVVHINAGIAGLVACLVLGRRSGYGTENMAPFNLVLTVIGASLLWIGWFGFNAGSAVAANGTAGAAMAATQVATAIAALAWMFSEWLVHGKPSVLGITSGAVAGLVAITPACGFVDVKGALVIGAAAGVGCYIMSTGVKKALRYDDSLDVFGVHAVGGIIGAILTGVFAVEAIGGTAGLLEGNFAQVPIQIYGVLATIAWCAVATFVILMLLKLTIGIRVSEAAEVEGLDVALHGESVQ